jgi:hypothetical protein
MKSTPLGLGLRPHHADQPSRKSGSGTGRLQPQAPGLDARQVQQAVDQLQQVLAAALHGRTAFARGQA